MRMIHFSTVSIHPASKLGCLLPEQIAVGSMSAQDKFGKPYTRKDLQGQTPAERRPSKIKLTDWRSVNFYLPPMFYMGKKNI